MLFNPKWEVEAKPDVFSLGSLIVWLEKQPSDGVYNFLSPSGCLLAQYFQAHGFADIQIGGRSYWYRGAKHRLSDSFRSVAYPEGRGWRFWQGTFGGALSRARALS